MTDNEIFENEIKCITRRNECVCNGGLDCVKCDLLMDSEEIVKCYNRAIKNLDLINRQKAEIKELEKANLQLVAILQTAQSEARKEFAERIKTKFGNLEYRDGNPDMKHKGECVLHEVVPKVVDIILKEMEGE